MVFKRRGLAEASLPKDAIVPVFEINILLVYFKHSNWLEMEASKKLGAPRRAPPRLLEWRTLIYIYSVYVCDFKQTHWHRKLDKKSLRGSICKIGSVEHRQRVRRKSSMFEVLI